MIEIDHEARAVSVEQLRGIVGDINGISPPKESVMARLSAPVTSNRIDMEKISFERNKSGIWGWRSDKLESINGYECKVYAASNVEFVTRSRNEHLNAEQARVRPFHLSRPVFHIRSHSSIVYSSKRIRERRCKASWAWPKKNAVRLIKPYSKMHRPTKSRPTNRPDRPEVVVPVR